MDNKLILTISGNNKVELKAHTILSLFKFYPSPDLNTYAFENISRLLSENLIRFTGPKEINDPADCSPEYIEDWGSNGLQSHLKNIIGRSSKNLQFVRVQKQLQKRFPNRASRRKDKRYQKFIRNSAKITATNLYKDRGFISFTESFDNTLMWSHYSSSHSGVCLEFRSMPEQKSGNHTELNISSFCIPIEYSDIRPKVFASSLFTDNPKDDAIVGAILTKFSDWRYEQEWRFLGIPFGEATAPETGEWVDAGKNPVASITFGINCSDATKLTIIDLISKCPYQPKLYQAKMLDSSYKISREDFHP